MTERLSEARTSRQRTSRGQSNQSQTSSQGHISQGQISQSQPSQGHISQGHISQGQISQSQPSQGHISQGQISQSQPSQGHISQGQIKQSQPSQGYISQGHISQGQISQGQSSQGQISQGQPSHGQISQGQMDINQLPQNEQRSGDGARESFHPHRGHQDNGTSAPNFPSHESPIVEATDTWWRVTFDCAGLDRSDVEVQISREQIVVQARKCARWENNQTRGREGVKFFQIISIPSYVRPSSLEADYQGSGGKDFKVVVTGFTEPQWRPPPRDVGEGPPQRSRGWSSADPRGVGSGWGSCASVMAGGGARGASTGGSGRASAPVLYDQEGPARTQPESRGTQPNWDANRDGGGNGRNDVTPLPSVRNSTVPGVSRASRSRGSNRSSRRSGNNSGGMSRGSRTPSGRGVRTRKSRSSRSPGGSRASGINAGEPIPKYEAAMSGNASSRTGSGMSGYHGDTERTKSRVSGLSGSRQSANAVNTIAPRRTRMTTESEMDSRSSRTPSSRARG